ncbi:uncharacterized protein LOC122813511 [Protopterus annectens]|uniref:uncharacterized protein LOC122813511 n=1 Tax=Protopterus annectens TaxID=7888 RepID=UPI001CF9BA44|nr:uncharacterized protein LOC122813511 [Protopterus annectens]
MNSEIRNLTARKAQTILTCDTALERRAVNTLLELENLNVRDNSETLDQYKKPKDSFGGWISANSCRTETFCRRTNSKSAPPQLNRRAPDTFKGSLGFKFKHYSDASAYIEQYRLVHTCGIGSGSKKVASVHPNFGFVGNAGFCRFQQGNSMSVLSTATFPINSVIQASNEVQNAMSEERNRVKASEISFPACSSNDSCCKLSLLSSRDVVGHLGICDPHRDACIDSSTKSEEPAQYKQAPVFFQEWIGNTEKHGRTPQSSLRRLLRSTNLSRKIQTSSTNMQKAWVNGIKKHPSQRIHSACQESEMKEEATLHRVCWAPSTKGGGWRPKLPRSPSAGIPASVKNASTVKIKENQWNKKGYTRLDDLLQVKELVNNSSSDEEKK